MLRFHRWNLDISRFIVLIALIICSTELFSQQSVQVIWPLTNDAESVFTSGIGHTAFKHGNSLTNFRFDSINGATSGGWNSRELNKQAYFEYSLTPEQDAEITITQLKFEVSLSSVNMRTAVHYSKDGFTNQSTPIGNTVYVGKRSSRDLLVETSIRVNYPETLSIRIYGWSAPNAAVNFFARDVEFTGIVKEKEKEKEEVIVAEQDGNEGGDRSILDNFSDNTPGVHSFTVPANVYNLTVECWGGGGGGSADGTADAGSGGGGGAYATATFPVTPGTVYSYTVGGVGPTGGTGGSSFFNTNQVLAVGGSGGVLGGIGGIGGQASSCIGDFAYSGGNGGNRESISGAGGGGGGSASSTGNGNNGNIGGSVTPGTGGLGGTGTGSGGNGGNTGGLGVLPGSNPGGGGGGAGDGGLSRTGGTGRVSISWCVSPTITLGAPAPNACFGATAATLIYSGVTQTPDQYRIDYSPAAEAQGFIDVPYTALPASPITLTVPAGAAVGTYSAQIYVQNTSTGCISQPVSFNITIKPLPVATVTNNAPIICSGSSTNIAVSSSIPGSTYTWTMTPVNVSGTLSGNSVPIIQTLNAATNGTATYSITPTANLCAGLPVSTVVNVNPIPDIIITPNAQTICSGQSTSIALTSSVAGTSFSWTYTQTNVIGGSAGSGNTIAQTLSCSPTNVQGTATYTVSATAASCPSGGPKNVIVTVNPTPTVSAVPASQTVCPDKNITTITISNPNNVAGTLFSWVRTDVPELSGIALNGTGNTISGAFSSTTPTVMLTTVFTITATANGCSSSTTASVTVGDNIAPIVTCPVSGTLNVTTNFNCTYVHTGTSWNATASDNCTVETLTYTLSGATTGTGTTLNNVAFNLGTTTVMWTVTDHSGNTTSCSFDILVTDDDNPLISCTGNKIAGTDNLVCTYTHTNNTWDANATDNCAGVITISYTLTGVTTGAGSTLNGVAFNKGVTTVTWTATDAAGRTATCNHTVTVNDDDPPIIACPVGNQVVNTNNACRYIHSGAGWDATATDNCTITSLTYTLSGATTGSGTTLNNVAFNAGVTTVTWTTSDGINTASCSYTVTVNDVIAPIITCPSNYTASANGVNCSTKLTTAPPSITENCTVTILTWVMTGATIASSPLTGINNVPANYDFNVGITTVTYTVIDQSGLFNSCSFTVTVTDNRPPVITCPTVLASYPNDPGLCSASLSFNATATDNCGVDHFEYRLGGVGGPVITFPYTFPVGTTTVTAIAYDFNNNSAPCSFNVVVADIELPTITCMGNQTRPADPGVCTYTAVGNEFDPIATGDNCGVFSVINNKTNNATLAGAVFGIGSTTVTWTVRDIYNNTSTCQITVTVSDNQPPVFSNCPTDITVFTGPGRTTCDQVATWTPPTATDNCSGAVPVTPNFTPGSTFPVGTTTVTYTAGSAPNISTCSFNVIVIDNTPPTFTVPVTSTIYQNASCNVTALPGASGDVTDEFDNCTPSGLNATFTDVTAAGSCPGESVITRTWRLSDNAIIPNITTQTQTIYIEDNTPPVLTLPLNITVSCETGTLPAITGNATAIDNCSGAITPTYTDVTAPDPFCPSGGIIARTWTAIDLCGNTISGVQTITYTDTQAPVGTLPNMTVPCPADIPVPDPTQVMATDNCGPVTVEFDYEIGQFPPGIPGYCPTWVDRYYKLTDACGNIGQAVHRITVLGPCDCAQCTPGTGLYTVDLLGQPSGTITLNNIPRVGSCCQVEWPSRCVSFTIRLDPAAVGLQITVDGATPGPKDWQVDCSDIPINDGIICIPGGTFYLFTYCKEGANKNDFVFTSLAGILTVDDVNARTGCTSQLFSNATPGTVTWTSVSPGDTAQYNSYLSCTDCPNPFFTPPAGAPPTIDYQVCGGVANSPCIGQGGVGCDVLTVTIYPPMSVTITPDPGAYCNAAIPTLTANVLPLGNFYSIQWYSGYGAIGTPLGTGTTFLPLVAGPYSIKITDTRPGIPCSTFIYDFDVAPDDQPPVITPPANLILECNAPGNTTAIQNWLQSATAIDDHTLNLSITNNYTALNIGCGAVTTVTWTAIDQCNNIGTGSATITLHDTQSPTWQTGVGALDRTLECSDATGIANAQALSPQATDQCDNSLTINKTAGLFIQDPLCPQRGQYINTFIAVDDCGKQSIVFSQIITITDNTAPVWTSTLGSLNVSIECSDAAGLSAAQALVPVATDNCDATLVIIKTAGSFVPDANCANEGTYTNTFITYDDCQNSSSVFTQIITITDNSLPVISTPAANITVECDGSGNLTELNNWIFNHGGAIASDICGTVTWTNSNPVFSNLCGETGIASVTFTVSDLCGNTATTSANFIIADNTAPVIACPPNVIANVDPATCEATGVNLGMPTVTEACSGPVDITNDAPTAFPGGQTTIVTWTATDDCGNVATCQQTVTVIDPIPPTVNCPTDVTVDNDAGFCTANVIVPSPVVTDPCPATVVNNINGTSNASGTYNVGTTVVIWTITGISGNITTCTQNITVIDNQWPTITCPADYEDEIINGDCDMIVDGMGLPIIWDNCPNPLLTWEMTGATINAGSGFVNGQTFNVGITTVTYTLADAAGHTVECTFDVWVKSITVPSFEVDCPADVTLPAAAGLCNLYVTVPSPVITNPCNEIYSITNDSPYQTSNSNASGTYPVGIWTITWTIIDASDNEYTCTQVITITDDELPTISCPANVEDFITNGGCTLIPANIGFPITDDNCGSTTLTWELSGATTGNGINFVNGQVFNVGITTVTYTVHDLHGNIETCFFTVWVKNLNAPQFEAFCPENETANNTPGRCDANVTVTPPTISNPCSEIFTMVNNSPYGTSSADASGIYPVGATTFNWTITDASGNVTICPQTVTVYDVEDPTISCPPDAIDEITNGDCNLVPGSLGIPTYLDNCLVTTLTWQMTGATTGSSPITGINTVNGQTFNVGITIVTYTATDAAGNSISCNFQVWIKNLTAPQFSATCPGNVTEFAGSSCQLYVTVPDPGINNPCNEAYTVTNNSPFRISDSDASGTYPVGTTSFTWTIVDASGNIITCPQSVTVIDNVPPVLDCPDDVEQFIINGGCDLSNVVIPAPTYTDNCGVVTLQWETEGATVLSSPSTGINIFSGYTLNVGVTTVIYTAIDASGNISICSFSVWIKNLDDPPFTVTCPADVTVSAPSDRCDADVTVLAPVIFNPCNEAYTMLPNGDQSGTYNIGTTTISWTITDASGNVTICDVDITVVDDTDPTLVCPPSFTANADFEQTYASNVPIPRPTVSDACGIDKLIWVLSGATSASSPLTGINWLDVYTLNVGVNTVTYTATDAYGNVSTCFFTITVLSEPIIECNGPIDTTTDPSLCSATLNPGYPELISGVEPITWTWTITDEGGTIIGSGTCTTASLPDCIGDFEFPVGVNTVTWTASNISGMDECVQTVTVIDDEPLTFTVPGSTTQCVNNIITSTYNPNPTPGIIPEYDDLTTPRPEYYNFTAGSTLLDLTDDLYGDNCCADEDIIIHWRIEFSPVPNPATVIHEPITQPPILNQTGLPSQYGEIHFPGDGVYFTDINHYLYYWLEDCFGNITSEKSITMTIKPRPNVIKQP